MTSIDHSTTGLLNTYLEKTGTSRALAEQAAELFPSGVTHDLRFQDPYPIYVSKQDEILVNRFQGGSYKIADIGCGDGYHGSTFGPSSKVYHGFEIAPAIADIARKRWREEGLDHAEVSVGDVTKATLQDEFYDLVFCLYFTAGNFRDQSKDLSLYTDQYLDRNPVFVALLSRLYKALKPGGSIFLTVYKDVPEAQAAQIDFYVHTGQHVVTPKGSRFVATAEGFWSARSSNTAFPSARVAISSSVAISGVSAFASPSVA